MRIARLLRSMAPQEVERVDLALTRGIFLAVAFVLILPTAVMHGGKLAAVMPLGWMLSWQLMVPSMFLVFALAGRLGGDSVGDFSSGLLDLILMSGLKPWRWVVVRVVQIWTGFASVWIVRLPLLVFLLAVGGVRLNKLIVVESLLITAFVVYSSFALNASFKAKSRQQVWARVMLPMLACEFLLHAPSIATGILSSYYGLALPSNLSNWIDTAASTSLTSRLLAAMRRPLELSECVPTFALYAVFSACTLWRFHQHLIAATQGRIRVREMDQTRQLEHQHGPQRASRRCWDDALAWQAYCVHSYGSPLVKVKCAGYTLLTLAMLLSIPFGYQIPMFVVAAATCLVVMLIAVGKPSDCLTREIRDQTMPTLLLTPNSITDYYLGWKRGALRLAWPEITFAVVLALAAFSIDPIAPPIVVSIAIASLFAGPFMMLSPLVPVTFSGIATGLGLTFIFVVIVGICITIGALTHPVFVPLILVPLASLFNYIIRRHVLPYWMERKIASIV